MRRPSISRANWKINAALAAAGIVTALGLGELALRLNPPAVIYMNTRNIVQQTHSEPSPDPKVFYVPRANLSKPFSNREFHTQVTVNSRHMRGREYSLEKPAGVKRIAAAGDSFVFGWGVEDREVFTAILEDRLLKNTEVLNFGVSGYTARQEMERLRAEAVHFHPDIVFLFLYGFPDDGPLDLEFRDGKLYSVLKDRKTPLVPLKIFLRRHVYLYWFYQEVKGWMLQRLTPQSPDSRPAPDPENIRRGLQVLADFKSLAAEYPFKPVVIYIPHKWNLLDPRTLERDSADIRRLEEFCRQNQIPFRDLTPRLLEAWKKSGQFPYFQLDDHWNARGHETAARIIAQILKEEKLLPEDFFAGN